MSRIGIITNPHSKLNKRTPWRPNLLSYIVGEKGRLEVTNTLSELSQVARDFRDRNIDILGISGGDGTVSQTLTAIIKEYGHTPLPKIALLRGGTMNMLASNLSIKGVPEQILYRLVEKYSYDENVDTISIPSLKVNNHYGFLYGNGIAANFLKAFYKNKSGPIGVVTLMLRLAMSRFTTKKSYRSIIRSTPTLLTYPRHSPLKIANCALFCSTVKKIPMGVTLFPVTAPEANEFQVTAFTGSPDEQIWQIPRILLGKGPKKNSVKFATSQLEIDSEDNGLYTLDGELFTPEDGRITITLGPCIEFVLI